MGAGEFAGACLGADSTGEASEDVSVTLSALWERSFIMSLDLIARNIKTGISTTSDHIANLFLSC